MPKIATSVSRRRDSRILNPSALRIFKKAISCFLSSEEVLEVSSQEAVVSFRMRRGLFKEVKIKVLVQELHRKI